MILIDSWPYDLMVSGELTFNNEITEHAVESGSDIADHIRNLPTELTFEGIVSDTPIGEIAEHESRDIEGEGGIVIFGEDQIPLPSDEAYARLLDIRDSKRLVTIEIPIATSTNKVGRRTFQNMGLERLTVPMNADTGGGLHFSVTFKFVKIVTNTRTTVRTSIQNPTKTKDHGLSLDKLVDGKFVLWRKGKPPGRSPATDPPGEIVGSEVVYHVKGKTYHSDKKTPLTTQELNDFTADLNRDTALLTRRGLARVDQRIDEIGDKLDRASKLLQAKEDNPGKYIDPALFGL